MGCLLFPPWSLVRGSGTCLAQAPDLDLRTASGGGKHNTDGVALVAVNGQKGRSSAASPLLRLPQGRAGHRLAQPGRVGRHFAILTDSATLFLPLMSHEILTFSPTFRPG